MQKKMEMGKVRTMKMMEKVISRIEQQSFEASSGSLGSSILTILREKSNNLDNKIPKMLSNVYLVLGRHFPNFSDSLNLVVW